MHCEDEKFKWTLPKGMTNYANKYFEEFIPNEKLKEAILMQSSVLENMDTVKKLDGFLTRSFKRKKATGFKSLRENCWEINQVTSKRQMDFF